MNRHFCLDTQMGKRYMLLLLLLLLLLISRFSHVRLCDPTDGGSPPGSPVPGILQARTRVGCHFLLQCMKVKSESEVTQSCPTLRPHELQPTRLLSPWDFPVKSTGVECHCLLHHHAYLSIKQKSKPVS